MPWPPSLEQGFRDWLWSRGLSHRDLPEKDDHPGLDLLKAAFLAGWQVSQDDPADEFH